MDFDSRREKEMLAMRQKRKDRLKFGGGRARCEMR